MAYHAKAKAEKDSDAPPWTMAQLVDFNAELERAPTTHRELWELAVSRMRDLKDDLERGDTSIASILFRVDSEEELRNFVGGWWRDRASGRYSIPPDPSCSSGWDTDYLRDPRSNRGVFMLLYRGLRSYWELPDGTRAENLPTLVDALRRRWAVISDRYPGIDDVHVIGIDLKERGRRPSGRPTPGDDALAPSSRKRRKSE